MRIRKCGAVPDMREDREVKEVWGRVTRANRLGRSSARRIVAAPFITRLLELRSTQISSVQARETMDFFIIDNDPTCREAVGFLLEDEGHTAEGMPWSKDIELRLQLKKCDAILLELDSTMPNALAPLLDLRTLRPDLPVVLLV